MKRCCSLILCCLVFASFVLSPCRADAMDPGEEKDPTDLWYAKAMNNATTTVDIVNVNTKGIQRWDARMNKAYQKLMKMLPPEGKKVLKAAQRQWLVFAKAEDALVSISFYPPESGTMVMISSSSYTYEFYRDRALALEWHCMAWEGDEE